MAAKRIVVTYFLEDPAHEAFIIPFVPIVAKEVNLSIRDDVRWAIHGSQVMVQLRRFLADAQRQPSLATDLLIVAVDGNDKGYQKKHREIQQEIAHAQFARPFVCAIPEPHIERWYLCDPEALHLATGSSVQPRNLPNKGQRDMYKNEYRRIVKEAGLDINLDGYEHARAIVENMDIAHLGAKDQSLGRFLNDLRSALKLLA